MFTYIILWRSKNQRGPVVGFCRYILFLFLDAMSVLRSVAGMKRVKIKGLPIIKLASIPITIVASCIACRYETAELRITVGGTQRDFHRIFPARR
jgi:hypothetical protein